MGNDNFTDEEKKNQQDAVSKLMKMIAAARANDANDSLRTTHKLTCERYKMMYDNFIAVGFTREEAFELLKIEVRSMADFVANCRLK
jgi:translation initiation factor 2 alpha subunit (eIF-2alpha)